MKNNDFSLLKYEVQKQNKLGVDFLVAATVLWFIITYIWHLDFTSYNRSIFTFMIGGLLLPLAYGFSKVFRTNWKVKNNPLQPLGLWINFAQLIYFPFLIFILIKQPDYFIMTYAIITGAHFFPYTWFYDEVGYAVASVLISVGALLIALNVYDEMMWMVPLFTALILLIFSIKLIFKTKAFKKS